MGEGWEEEQASEGVGGNGAHSDAERVKAGIILMI